MSISRMLWMVILLLVSACQTLASPSTATLDLPDHILFFGNSLTYWNMGVPEHVKELAASANPSLPIEVLMIASSGATLEDHWGYTDSAIREGPWDFDILQEYPQGVQTNEQFFESVRKFNEEIKKAGAQTVLYMTWERGSPNPAVTIEKIAQAHSLIATELGIKVAPVGLAWQRSIQERPNLELFEPDRDHPSVRGTYLASCVLYATIFGQSPIGIDYQPADMIAGVESSEGKWEKWLMTEDEVAFFCG